VLLFAVPFLSELKISWAFVAVPLHIQRNDFPLWTFGAILSIATFCRVFMNAMITASGDWSIVPILVAAASGAVYMLAAPYSIYALAIGVAAGHTTDTAQVQANLCYRWRANDAAAQKRGLRLQAFSATFGYSSGALLGGALYEHAGFLRCAQLQVSILSVMALLTSVLPVVRAAFSESCTRVTGAGTRDDGAVNSEQRTAPQPATAPRAAVAPDTEAAQQDATLYTLRGSTTRCLMLPVSLIWLSVGCNIACYISEWSLFAVYFADAFGWSSTLTGAAQMAGDLLAAVILALTTTRMWARLLRHDGLTRKFERMLFPPFNISIFFALYSLTFWMLAQPTFMVSVLGQIFMGTVYVFNKQALQECFVVLSHGSLSLFRVLEFGGTCSFNLCMSAATVLAVLVYENIGQTTPFIMVSGVSGVWAVIFAAFFIVRLRGHHGLSWSEAEHMLLMNRSKRGEQSYSS